MKRLLLFVGIALTGVSLPVMGQGYYSTTLYHWPEAFLNGLRGTNYTVLMQAPADDVFAGPFNLGFSFPFYGQSYTQFWVSDNGYIVFDTTGNVSTGNNTAIPNTAAPNGAIYAYWDNMQMSTNSNPNYPDQVRMYQWGTAPNRAVTLLWYSVTLNSDGLVYAYLTLYEDGSIEIAPIRSATQSSAFGGTVGIESPDGQQALMIGGPDFKVDNSDLKSYQDTRIYRIQWGFQPRYETEMRTVLPSHAYKGKKTPLGGVVYNHGSETITSLKMRYQAASLFNVGYTFNVTIPPGGYYEFEFPSAKQWTPISSPSLDSLRLFVDEINGQPDSVPANSTAERMVFVGDGTSAARNVVLEEFTGAWCGFCPDGALKVEDIELIYPEFVAIARHVGDAMATSLDDSLAAYYGPAYPQALIDRYSFGMFEEFPKDRSDQQHNNLWADYIGRRKNATDYPSSIELKLHKTYDPTTRQLTIRVRGEFKDHDYGDIRVHALLLQDSVTGSGQGYDQVNYYSHERSGTDPNHPLYNYPDPIVGYRHNHVARKHFTPLWGTALAASPTQYAPGDTFSMEWTYTLPSDVDERYAYPVAFVSYFEGTRPLNYNYIINGIKSEYLMQSPSGIAEASSGTPIGIRLAPNPATDVALLRFSLDKRAPVSVRLYDVTGRHMVKEFVSGYTYVKGNHSMWLPLHGVPAGTYLVVVDVDGVWQVGRLVVQ